MGVGKFWTGSAASGSKIGGWKPYSMRAPILALVILATLALAGVIEFLAQKSLRNGGLGLSDTPNGINSAVRFGYLYAPTIVAVSYSLIWTWIDLDVRRMQPWLELSRPDGAMAKNSLLLDYPFSFLAVVPFRAWKNKHWPVFCAGTALVLIFWGITPLQSAIFGERPVVLTSNITLNVPSVLAPIEDQATEFTPLILNQAYAISWFGQEFPPFTTADYALLPVVPQHNAEPAPNKSWTAETTKLSTELNCWPANVTKTADWRVNKVDNGRGCSYEVQFFQSPPRANDTSSIVLYIGYGDDATLDYHLGNPNCSSKASNQFLAVWALDSYENHFVYEPVGKFDITASFCEASYHKQNVSVKISSETQRPINGSLTPTGPVEILEKTEFNSSAFEHLIHVGLPPVTTTRDFAATTTIEPYPVLGPKNISWPSTTMVTFAMGFMKDEITSFDLQNSSVLHEAFSRAHKAIFSLAVSSLLVNTKSPDTRPGILETKLYGVVISRPIAIVVEVLLLVVTLLTLALLITSYSAQCLLWANPASISLTLDLLRSNPRTLDPLMDCDTADDDSLKRQLLSERYAIVNNLGQSMEIQEAQPLKLISLGNDESGKHQADIDVEQNHITYKPLQPLWLRMPVGTVVICALLGGLAGLVYLKQKERALNGLARPTENIVMLQVLENYVPTVFSTLLEPLLVVLARLLCVLQPFRELQRGKACAENTLDTKYTSLPPQLIIWRAIRSKHFLLGILCFLTFLANVLAVALGGIFNESTITVEYPTMLQQTRIASLTRDTFKDESAIEPINAYRNYFYNAYSNISANTSLPPWTSPNFAFLPIPAVTTIGDNTTVLRGRTRGFGVEPKCVPLSTSASATSYVNMTQITKGKVKPNFLYQHENGTWITCRTTASTTGSDPVGKCTRQFTLALQPNREYPVMSESGDYGFCQDKLVLGWARTPSVDTDSEVDATFINCEAQMRTGMFDVTFSPSTNIILSYEQVGELEEPLEFWNHTQSTYFVRQATRNMGDDERTGGYDYGWHNTTVTTDWFNFILVALLNSTELVDPLTAAPKHELVIPAVQDVYRRLFAVTVGQRLDIFQAPAEPLNVNGTMIVQETRIFLDDTAYIITLAILSFNIFILIILYIKERRPFLPRFPSTIASLMAYVAASRFVRDKNNSSSYSQRGRYMERMSSNDTKIGGKSRVQVRTASAASSITRAHKHLRQTYSFGRFLGVDGKTHIGIEADPFVMPINEDGTPKMKGNGIDLFLKKSWSRRNTDERTGNFI